jgi:hypothetical protein
MLSKNTAPTEALSVSKVLPDGCVAYRNGLVLPEGLPHDEWQKIGKQITQLASASMWMIGDWLAYGQVAYKGLPGFERMENDRYSKVAADTGLAEGSLRNAKYICAAVNLSRRRDKLTFGHAQEIVGRVAPAQFDFWVDRAVSEGLSTKKLREELRKSTATHKPEPNDVGVTTDIEWLRQIERDFLHKAPKWNPAMKLEALKIIKTMAGAVS